MRPNTVAFPQIFSCQHEKSFTHLHEGGMTNRCSSFVSPVFDRFNARRVSFPVEKNQVSRPSHQVIAMSQKIPLKVAPNRLMNGGVVIAN